VSNFTANEQLWLLQKQPAAICFALHRVAPFLHRPALTSAVAALDMDVDPSTPFVPPSPSSQPIERDYMITFGVFSDQVSVLIFMDFL